MVSRPTRGPWNEWARPSPGQRGGVVECDDVAATDRPARMEPATARAAGSRAGRVGDRPLPRKAEPPWLRPEGQGRQQRRPACPVRRRGIRPSGERLFAAGPSEMVYGVSSSASSPSDSAPVGQLRDHHMIRFALTTPLEGPGPPCGGLGIGRCPRESLKGKPVGERLEEAGRADGAGGEHQHPRTALGGRRKPTPAPAGAKHPPGGDSVRRCLRPRTWPSCVRSRPSARRTVT